MSGKELLSTTESLCPVCLTKIPARRVAEGARVYLEKSCLEHGHFSTLIWEGPPYCSDWARPKTKGKIHNCFTEEKYGCPHDCGLCPNHRQQTCTALIEVTNRCNLHCPVCFADSGSSPAEDADLETVKAWYEKLQTAGGTFNIQLSGGEPTVRDDLAEIIAMGRSLGFGFIQLNTNGIRLAREPEYLESLKKAGLSSLFLQFDGTDDEIFKALRGKPLLAEKIRVIEVCRDLNIGVVLVPTLVPGINTGNLGAIIKLALNFNPVVRGVHFQPISYFGRYSAAPTDEERITIPRVIRALEEQTGGLVRADNFRPPGCENAYCSFHGNFMVGPDGSLTGNTRPEAACCQPELAEQGARQAISSVAAKWSLPMAEECSCAEEKSCLTDSWDNLIADLLKSSFSISGMAFQDAWNIDLERLRDCCIHVVGREGTLIPFCAYNLTSSSGRALYRG
jgi:uncharacterized radical SAM superfamily Fe-S cluster-containing enzyme